LPKQYHDQLPPPPAHIPINSSEPEMDEEEQIPASIANVQDHATHNSYEYHTEPDSYGVIRQYSQGKPSITPDEHYSLASVSESPYLALDPSESSQPHATSPLQKFCSATSTAQTLFAPFSNMSSFRLMSWFYGTSGVKSLSELNSLVKDVLLAPDFKTEDLVGFNAKKEHKVMDSYQEVSTDGPSSFTLDDSWIKGLVKIQLPCDGVKQSEADAPTFVVEVYYRKLLDVIKAALAEPSAEQFHTFPFKAFWQPGQDEPEERIYAEAYTGDRWNKEYEKIYATNKQGPHGDLEAVLIALMIWSDATLLAQFGNAQLWPIYLYIGNQSKYSRAKPSSFAAHHIAYIPKVCLALLQV
jgi:Plavaka transposase